MYLPLGTLFFNYELVNRKTSITNFLIYLNCCGSPVQEGLVSDEMVNKNKVYKNNYYWPDFFLTEPPKQRILTMQRIDYAENFG